MTYGSSVFLTPWIVVLHDKLIIAYLVEKFPAFHGKPVLNSGAYTISPLDVVLHQTNSDRTHSHIVISYLSLDLHSGSFTSCFLARIVW